MPFQTQCSVLFLGLLQGLFYSGSTLVNQSNESITSQVTILFITRLYTQDASKCQFSSILGMFFKCKLYKREFSCFPYKKDLSRIQELFRYQRPRTNYVPKGTFNA